jgi:pantetheine-phosphate adenylyltransferase
MNIAVFPGSFDPITLGHVDIVLRARPLFDKVIVAVGVNSSKSTLYSLDQRLEWLRDTFNEYEDIEIGHFEGLTVNFCKKHNANYLIRGLRNSADFDYEKTISQVNHAIGGDIETLFLISQPGYSHISSTVVREIIKGNADITDFVPVHIAHDILKNYRK